MNDRPEDKRQRSVDEPGHGGQGGGGGGDFSQSSPRPVIQDVTINGHTFRITVHVAAIEPGGGGQGGGGGGDFSG